MAELGDALQRAAVAMCPRCPTICTTCFHIILKSALPAPEPTLSVSAEDVMRHPTVPPSPATGCHVVAEWGFRYRVIRPVLFCSFLHGECKVPPTFLYIAAVSASHSDQLLRTLHSTHPFLHYMLIFCSFCCLPSQSQRSDSLLRLCLEALFGAQSRVVLPRRGCFQALLSGCTILPII